MEMESAKIQSSESTGVGKSRELGGGGACHKPRRNGDSWLEEKGQGSMCLLSRAVTKTQKCFGTQLVQQFDWQEECER